ncbi:isocitrate lyase/phosphoenolpyruvate mutase family protein [Streptomyces bobili]|uniref:isocitrate lyase/phosphoenolpyruvate mutase family protein n=1 Tax=Streptomyces bobili TaxID=67280 RepID=UPI00382C3747
MLQDAARRQPAVQLGFQRRGGGGALGALTPLERGHAGSRVDGQVGVVRVAIERLVAFAEAGADCLFAPGLGRPEDIAAIVRAVAPKPVNVLASNNPALPAARLADLGVRRISTGSSLARVASALGNIGTAVIGEIDLGRLAQ